MKNKFSNKLAYKLLDFTKNKLALKTDEEINKYLKEKNIKNKEEFVLHPYFEDMYDKIYVNGMKCYVINKNDNNKHTILYLHGGSYIDQPLYFHFTFLNKIAKKSDSTIYVPIYPKIPCYTYKSAYNKVLKLYKMIYTDNIILMGDSAGGGFALGLAMEMVKDSIKLPLSLILISPWINLAMDNPLIPSVEEEDPMLSSKQLKVFGSLWAGNSKVTNPLVSPFYGSLDGLPKIFYFTGDKEILYPDALLFKERCDREDIYIKFIVNKNMYHCYPLFPLKDGKRAIKQIVKIIDKNNL